jgi:hypothetical protein
MIAWCQRGKDTEEDESNFCATPSLGPSDSRLAAQSLVTRAKISEASHSAVITFTASGSRLILSDPERKLARLGEFAHSIHKVIMLRERKRLDLHCLVIYSYTVRDSPMEGLRIHVKSA